ncbi:Serine/threonine-protein kinase Sgk1, partial [Blyttiomyces sp. JEL0837]
MSDHSTDPTQVAPTPAQPAAGKPMGFFDDDEAWETFQKKQAAAPSSPSTGATSTTAQDGCLSPPSDIVASGSGRRASSAVAMSMSSPSNSTGPKKRPSQILASSKWLTESLSAVKESSKSRSGSAAKDDSIAKSRSGLGGLGGGGLGGDLDSSRNQLSQQPSVSPQASRGDLDNLDRSPSQRGRDNSNLDRSPSQRGRGSGGGSKGTGYGTLGSNLAVPGTTHRALASAVSAISLAIASESKESVNVSKIDSRSVQDFCSRIMEGSAINEDDPQRSDVDVAMVGILLEKCATLLGGTNNGAGGLGVSVSSISGIGGISGGVQEPELKIGAISEEDKKSAEVDNDLQLTIAKREATNPDAGQPLRFPTSLTTVTTTYGNNWPSAAAIQQAQQSQPSIGISMASSTSTIALSTVREVSVNESHEPSIAESAINIPGTTADSNTDSSGQQARSLIQQSDKDQNSNSEPSDEILIASTNTSTRASLGGNGNSRLSSQRPSYSMEQPYGGIGIGINASQNLTSSRRQSIGDSRMVYISDSSSQVSGIAGTGGAGTTGNMQSMSMALDDWKYGQLPRLTGTVPVFVHDDFAGCMYVSMLPNKTVHEVRKEVLVKLGVVELTESFEIKLLERMSDGKLLEKIVDPNMPLDCILHDSTAYPDRSTTPGANTLIYPINFRIRRKPRIRWSITVNIEGREARSLVVDSTTTVKDILEILMVIEGIPEEECDKWALWFEADSRRQMSKMSNVLGIKLGPGMETETDQVDEDLKTSPVAERKRRNTFFGTGIENRNKSMASIYQKNSSAFSMPPADTSTAESPLLSPKVSGSSSTNLKGFAIAENSQAQTRIVRNRSFSKNLHGSGGGKPHKGFLTTDDKQEHICEEKESNSVDSIDMIMGEDSTPVKKENKIADFFGVSGKKELAAMQGKIEVRKRPSQGSVSVNKPLNFLARIYFGNMTYTVLNLPLNATVSTAIFNLLQKLSIKDPPEDYAIFEYHLGAERELEANCHMYELLCTWQNAENFLFKRRARKPNLLRTKATQQQDGDEMESPLSIGAIEKSTSETIDDSEPSGPGKRVAKLAGFFGVDSASGATGTSTKAGASNKKAGNDIASELLEEFCKMLNVNDKQSVFALGSKQKDETTEGWLYYYNEEDDYWTSNWSKIKDRTLFVQPSESRDAVIASFNESKSILKISLRDSVVEVLSTADVGGYGTGAKNPFSVTDAQGGRYLFATTTAEELDLWQRRITGSVNSDSLGADKKAAVMSMSDFEVHKVLGRGKYGTVLLCSQKSTNKIYAIKVINREEGSSGSNVDLEVEIMKKMKHPFIVNLHVSFESPTRHFLVMDYVNGGELFFHVCTFGRFTEERVRFYAAEIYLALRNLHTHGYIYRDLKLENILLDKEGHIQIADFGLCRRNILADLDDQSLVGTLEYLAPEVLQGYGTSPESDFWALGIVMFEMLCAYHPFYSEDRTELKMNIVQSPLEFPSQMSSKTQQFLTGLLQRDPRKRLGYGDSSKIEQHPYFAGLDFAALQEKKLTPPYLPEVVDDFDVRFFDEMFTNEAAP